MTSRMAALPLLAAVLFAGCSAAPTAPAPAPASSAASPGATTPSAAASSPTSGLAAPQNATVGQPVDVAALGEQLQRGMESLRSATVHSDVKGTVQGQTFELSTQARVDYSDRSKPRSAAEMTGVMPMSIVQDGDTLYFKAEMLGNSWYRATRAELQQKTGQTLPDPADQVAQANGFVKAADSATFVGTETVDGVETRHYTVKVRQDALAEASGQPSATPSSGAQSELVPLELYVDAQGVSRRVTTDLASGGSISTDTRTTSINEPVQIEIPADAQPLPQR